MSDYKQADQNLKDKLYKKIEEKTDKMIQIRRYLHQHPELSFEEKETGKYIANFYKDLDVKVESNYGDGYGVVVTIDSGKPGKTIALRADFDGLPVKEETGLPYASQNEGVMHACGHDGHTAYLLILAECLNELKDDFDGKVKIIHQPAEETPPGGAPGMIKAGVLKGVDGIIGVHGWAIVPYGTVQCTVGPVMTGRSSFKLTIHGKGGHGSAPNLANDANVAASYFVTIAQTIISRRTDPFDMCTLTIGNFDGRGSFNVIKDSVFLEGDVRFMNVAERPIIEKNFKNIVKGLEIMFGVKVDLFYNADYPVLDNDENLTKEVQYSLENSNIKELEKVDTISRNTASEDFAYFSQNIPGVYMFVGEMPDDGVYSAHHSPTFVINEKALPLAAKTVGAAALDFLANK
ncbi:amidohydrolase [Companilactobacillus nuruki]|uniref:Amidohydrolase n=1 Tax=Companilactobacillus nuruki TaxID=1993540 RepID=A0A2N7AXS2_9LACO|nr:amidohydrolase [Companilactobacillus nuruki]PMD73889.1 amidohydrolase [Companilactobacillus nuruki]